jgi:hypothetical protein
MCKRWLQDAFCVFSGVNRSFAIVFLLLMAVPVAHAMGHHHASSASPNVTSGSMHAMHSMAGMHAMSAMPSAADMKGDAHGPHRMDVSHGDVCFDNGSPVPGGSGHDDCLGCCPDSAGASDAVTTVRPTVCHPEMAASKAVPVRRPLSVLSSGPEPPLSPHAGLHCVLRL